MSGRSVCHRCHRLRAPVGRPYCPSCEAGLRADERQRVRVAPEQAAAVVSAVTERRTTSAAAAVDPSPPPTPPPSMLTADPDAPEPGAYLFPGLFGAVDGDSGGDED